METKTKETVILVIIRLLIIIFILLAAILVHYGVSQNISQVEECVRICEQVKNPCAC